MAALQPGQTFGEIATGPAPGATLSRHAPGQALPLHCHEAAYACLVLAGGFQEQDATRRAGDVIVHPRGEDHADRFGPAGALCLNLHLEGDAQPLARRADPDLARAAEALAAEVAKGPCGDGLEAQSLAAEIVDRLARPGPAADPDCVARVLEALADAPGFDWTLAELAVLARRHPTHLARVFRLRTGCSLGAYRRRRRLTRLAVDLRLGREPLADLALEHGFSDQAHMSREFRRFSGLSPAAWRRAAR